jgi:hypothetical protein
MIQSIRNSLAYKILLAIAAVIVLIIKFQVVFKVTTLSSTVDSLHYWAAANFMLGIYLLERGIRIVFGDRVELGKLVEEQYIGAPGLVCRPDQESISAAFLDGQADQLALDG